MQAERCNNADGWVAPNAGDRAKKIQTVGLQEIDKATLEYKRRGVYTRKAARASYNAFIRMAIVSGDGNILNISGATRLPEGVNSHFLLEEMGKKILGTDIRAARYGRTMLMSVDAERVNFEGLFDRFTEAAREINTNHFPKNEARVLNILQDKRAVELHKEVKRAEGVMCGTVEPNIAAVSDESKGKEYFIWTGRRKRGVIEGINPDGVWQDQSELSRNAPDLVTKALLAHELDLLLSTQEGKIRIIFIGDQEAYVKRCCVATSNEQHFVDNFIRTPDKFDMKQAPNEVVVYGDDVVVKYKNGEMFSTADYCSKCSSQKRRDSDCKCSKEKSHKS